MDFLQYIGSEFNLGYQYAKPTTVILVCATWGPMIPVVLFTSLIGMIFEYFAIKYVVLRRIKKPI